MSRSSCVQSATECGASERDLEGLKIGRPLPPRWCCAMRGNKTLTGSKQKHYKDKDTNTGI